MSSFKFHNPEEGGGSTDYSNNNFNLMPPSRTEDKYETSAILKYKEKKYKRSFGRIGNLIGGEKKKAAINIAFLLCLSFIALFFVDMIHSYAIGESINDAFLEKIIPVLTLALGYIFGKG